MPADSGAVDAAVFGALGADATLKTLCPDGVWRNQAPQAKTRVIVVIQADHADSEVFGGPLFETFTYAITAVLKDQSAVAATQAAHRIRQVLEALPAPAGYAVTMAQRQERIAYSEPDPVNPDAFWQHFGGLYAVMVEPL